MIVTLDVFSGRPNPTWNLNEKDAKKFAERFAGKSVTGAENTEVPLGYRGFSIESASDVVLPDNIPQKFYVGGTLSESFAAGKLKSPLLTADETDSAVKWLLSTAGNAVTEDVANYVKETLKEQKKGMKEAVKEPAEDTLLKDLKAVSACVIQSTPYNPAFWNDPVTMQNNNCYNYAMNYRSNTFAQPGRRSGHPAPFPPICSNIQTAANWDGCKATCAGGNKLVALVIWPGNDYHWYRKHSEGFWGHKPGHTAARNYDSLNRKIDGIHLTPFNCARGPYTIFCSYLYSPTGMIVS